MALGYAHPDLLLRELTSWQITEWLAFYQIEPFGEERADLRAGIVAATVANVNRGEDGEPFTPDQFMPRFDRDGEDRRQSVEEQVALVETLAAVFGGELTQG